jgi:hypothetical protein
MCSLDVTVSQLSVLPMDVCSTAAFDIPGVSVQHRPLLSLDVCGLQQFVLSFSLNFACSVNMSCAAINMHLFINLFIYYTYLLHTFVKSFPGQGKGNFMEISCLGTGTPTAFQGYGKNSGLWKGNMLVISGLGTGTLTGFQRPWKNSGLGKGNILENSGMENRDINGVTNIFGEFRAGAR